MEIVAFDTDDRADGQGKAGITWISKYCLISTCTPSTTGSAYDWETSNIRNWLSTAILPLIPSSVRSEIVAVTKVQRASQSGSVVLGTTTDSIWIPSANELVGNAGLEKDVGVYYQSAFPDATSRAKAKVNNTGIKVTYVLRSAYGATTMFIVSRAGALESALATSPTNTAIGFCTN